jgi:DNA polymerase-3 subunit epsilon
MLPGTDRHSRKVHMNEADTSVAASLQLGFGFDETEAAGAAGPTRARKAKITPRVAAQLPEPEAMARALDDHADYRVLRRLPVVTEFARRPTGPVTRVLILDTETTGLDASRDRIMELALLGVDVDTATGLPTGAVDVYDGLEDPGTPISAEIQALTGINDAMVRGQRLDEQRVADMLGRADLVLAHNAGFDRPFAEARLPQFAQLPWGCSFADLDWKKEGHGSAKLTQLAQELGWFYDAHRAEMDCHALLAVLAAPLASGLTGLAGLLAAASRPSYRLQATGAPFEAKDLLKGRGYRWDGTDRVWHTRIGDEAGLDDECNWLKQSVYGSRAAQVQVESFDAGIRYSSRPGRRVMRAL